MADKNTKSQERPVSAFGAGNLKVEDTPDKVTIAFDPRVIIGRFKPSAKAAQEGRSGSPKVASTGSYRTLDISGVRVMLHVIGRDES